MSLVWTEHHRCQHCTAGSGQHFEHCLKFKPDLGELYRLTKACPTCSIPDSRPCVRCHHPRGLHDEIACAFFLACQCEGYDPIPCQFRCRDGRLVPERVKYIIRWHLGFVSRPMLDSEVEDVVFALDAEASSHYPEWPDSAVHHGHVHIEMKLGDLDEPEAESDI